MLTGEVLAETVAQGPNLVIQEFSKSFWQPNAGCCFEQFSTRQGNGALVEAQTYRVPGRVGSVSSSLG